MKLTRSIYNNTDALCVTSKIDLKHNDLDSLVALTRRRYNPLYVSAIFVHGPDGVSLSITPEYSMILQEVDCQP